MSCKSAIYAVNSAPQILAVDSVVNFGTIIRRYGCGCALVGGNIVLNSAGYYDVDVNLNLTGTAAGPVTITLEKDGVPIPGASATITTAAAGLAHVTIPAIIRQICPCEATITAVISQNGVQVDTASISVEKI